MRHEVWLSFNNREEVLQLPIAPMFKLHTAQGVETMTLQKLGEISLPGLKSLDSITLDFCLPAQDYYFLQYHDIKDPWDCVELIKKWKATRRPIRLIITGTTINVAMLIKTYSYGVQDGTNNVECALELIEYVFLESPKLATFKGTNFDTAVAGSHSEDTEWTVRYGDTLTGIAKAVYGDLRYWEEIYKANKDLITDPYRSLKYIEGEKLKLPKIAGANAALTEKSAQSLMYKDVDEYVIKVGDTLTGSALAKYGDASKWEDIYRANRDKIDNPNSLKGIAGQKIILVTYPE